MLHMCTQRPSCAPPCMPKIAPPSAPPFKHPSIRPPMIAPPVALKMCLFPQNEVNPWDSWNCVKWTPPHTPPHDPPLKSSEWGLKLFYLQLFMKMHSLGCTDPLFYKELAATVCQWKNLHARLLCMISFISTCKSYASVSAKIAFFVNIFL